MATISLCGFEMGALADEATATQASANRPTITGNATLETSIVRTGSGSLKIAPASGAAATFDTRLAGLAEQRFALRITALPATNARNIIGLAAGRTLRIQADGKLRLYTNGSTLSSAGTATLTDTTRWYVIRIAADGVNMTWFVDGVQDGTVGQIGGVDGLLGASDTVADTYTAYIDDWIASDTVNAVAADGNVVLLKPTSDSAIGGWTKPGGGTTNLNTSVDNTPPVGVADSTSSAQAENQIRNATANNNYVVNMATYASAGIGASDTVNAVRVIAETAAPSSTGAKTGTLQITSNPAEASAFSFGNFHSGANAGTYTTGWKANKKTPTENPTVTVGSAPQVTLAINGGTTSRIAMCCFIGIYVDYTPAVAAGNPPYRNPMVQLLPQ